MLKKTQNELWCQINNKSTTAILKLQVFQILTWLHTWQLVTECDERNSENVKAGFPISQYWKKKTFPKLPGSASRCGSQLKPDHSSFGSRSFLTTLFLKICVHLSELSCSCSYRKILVKDEEVLQKVVYIKDVNWQTSGSWRKVYRHTCNVNTSKINAKSPANSVSTRNKLECVYTCPSMMTFASSLRRFECVRGV